MNNFSLYYHTLKYLKCRQIIYRLWYRLYRRKVRQFIHQSYLQRRKLQHKPSPFCLKPIAPYFKNNANYLDHTVDINNATIWNSTNQEKLWLYHLHYFDALNAKSTEQQSKAYLLLNRWIQQNPPFIGAGWEPYPISLRIVNMIKYYLAGNHLSDAIIQSLYLQARYLAKHCEYHLLGNHLFENYKALCFAGLFFNSRESNRWLKKGFVGLTQEIKTQILPDGGHFELSPMYHGIILEGLLDLKNLFMSYGQTFPWDAQIELMLEWLQVMQRPNNEFSYFNDTAQGVALSPYLLCQYAARLGINAANQRKHGLAVQYLSSSGYISLENEAIKMLLDTANIGPDYLPGHAHADTLSFELYRDKEPVIINLGTSCYGLSDRRLVERSTAAHNTVSIDGQNSSEVWSAFRVARRAKITNVNIDQNKGGITVTATHDGFCRRGQSISHERTWYFKDNEVIIDDNIIGKFQSAVSYIHLHPQCVLTRINQREIIVTTKSARTIKLMGECKIEVIDSYYAQEFGKLIKTKSLCIPILNDKKHHQLKIVWG